MSELKKCPFCSGDVGYRDLGMNRITIHCRTCNVTLGETWGVNIKSEMESMWNTRTLEDALSAENAKLREAWEEANAIDVKLRARITALEAAGDELANVPYEFCPFCEAYCGTTHSPDCPVEKWKAIR